MCITKYFLASSFSRANWVRRREGWSSELDTGLRGSCWDSGGWITHVSELRLVQSWTKQPLSKVEGDCWFHEQTSQDGAATEKVLFLHLMGQELAGHIFPGEGRGGIWSRGGERCQVSGREAWAEWMRERVGGRGAIPALATNCQRLGRPPSGLF